MCATPTLTTTPTSGRAIPHRYRMCPGPREPISRTRNRVRSSAWSTVCGRPSSLLNDPGGATTAAPGNAAASNCAVRSLVVVLPDEPVMPTTVRSGSRSRTARASRPIAVSASATMIMGTPSTGRVPITAVAPASWAAPAKSCPSTFPPGNATNSAPGPTRRESNSTVPVTTVAGSAPSRLRRWTR